MNEPMKPQALVDSSDEIDLLRVLMVFAQNAKLLVFGSFLIGCLALALSFWIPPIYTATTRILPPAQQQGAAALLAQQLGSLAGLASATAGIKNPADMYVAMLGSRTIADRIIDRFKLIALYEVPYRQDARKKLSSQTRIKAGKDGVITLEVDGLDPKRAADIANAYVAELQVLTETLAVTEAGQRRVFFEKQLQKVKDTLTAAEIALRGSGVNESTLKADPQAAVEGVARIKAGIAAAEVRLASLRGYLTGNSVEVRQAEQELSALRAQLAKLEHSDENAFHNEGAQYIARYREYKYYETLFELVAKQYELARLDEAREGGAVQVIDAALPPERKSRPKKALIAVAATVIAFLLLTIAVFLRETYRSALADPEGAKKIERIRAALRRNQRAIDR